MKIWLICYDISDNSRRYFVDKELQGYGERVQWSAFECVVSANQFKALYKALENIITDEDKINYYPLCHWCKDKRQGQGQAQIIRNQQFYVI